LVMGQSKWPMLNPKNKNKKSLWRRLI
jgi:hypothetical protein